MLDLFIKKKKRVPFTWWGKMFKCTNNSSMKASLGHLQVLIHTTQWLVATTLYILFYSWWEEGKNKRTQHHRNEWHTLQCGSTKCAILGCVCCVCWREGPTTRTCPSLVCLGSPTSPLASIINLKHAPSLSTTMTISEKKIII